MILLSNTKRETQNPKPETRKTLSSRNPSNNEDPHSKGSHS